MKLTTDTVILEFFPVKLNFLETTTTNQFAYKNNKTVAETLTHKRYAHLAIEVGKNYTAFLSEKLGDFLLRLKLEGDPFYLKFLNKYGDKTFCTFSIAQYRGQKGLYSYVVDGKIKYIGRCKDNFGKRINQGYGRIHPKNCYIDGQATNCHLNSLIAENKNNIEFFVCPLQNDTEIDLFERYLIQKEQPLWNIALKGVQPVVNIEE